MPPRRKLVRLSPPHKGIVEGLAYEDHNPISTVDAQNVRGHDPATGRLRLSQRPGLVNKASAAPAASQKADGGGPIQNISTLTLTQTSPHTLGSECVVIKADGTPQIMDNSTSTPSLLAGTTVITGEDYQFSVFDKDGNLYVVTIDQTIDGSGNYAKKIRKYARPYTTGVLLSAYDETSKAKDRQVLGYALHGDVLFTWWNGAVSSITKDGGGTITATGEEAVTANRISDGKRVDNAGNQVDDPTSFFLQSPGSFAKANGIAGSVNGRIKNIMSSGGGVISLVAGISGSSGSKLHQFSIYTGRETKAVALDTGETSHFRYDTCTDVRGRSYAITSYDTGGNRVFRLTSAPKAYGLTWSVESTNTSSSGTATNVGNMSSVAVDDWGEETLVYVAGEGMKNSSWVKHQTDNDYNVSAASNDRHGIVLFDGSTGGVINGGSPINEMTITRIGDVSLKIQVTVADHNLSDGDRVYIDDVYADGREEANTDDSAPNLTYVKRIDDDVLELYEDKALATPQGPTGGAVRLQNGKLQDISEIGIIRAYNGINKYTGRHGGMSFGWNRARSNYAFDQELIGLVRVLVDKYTSSNVQTLRLTKRIRTHSLGTLGKDIFTGAIGADQRVACHPHAVAVGDSGREVQHREQLITVTSGGDTRLFTTEGGFTGTDRVATKEPSLKFFSTEFSRFVDSELVKGPYTLICDGQSYSGMEFTPYQHHAFDWTDRVSAGSLPVDEGNYARLIESWRGRVVLSGVKTDPSNWFMSAYGNPLDWDYSPAVTLETQAVAGNNSSAGKSPDIINSIVPYSDDLLFFGGDKSIWQMTGDPMSGGRLDRVSGGTGMAWGRAWAVAPNGTLFFFGSRGGVYSMTPAVQGPQRLAIGSLDYELTNINLYENQILMEWSTKEEGLYVFVCPASPVNSPKSYFWDSRSDAWWKDVFPEGMSPSFVATIDGDKPDDREILIGSCNGAVYSLSETAGDDDGTEINSYAFIGPITTGTEGLIAIDEMQYILPTSGNPLSYSVHTGKTVKESVESPAFFTGDLVAGDNAADRRRVVSKNIFVKIHNKSGEKKPWTLEGVNVYAIAFGAAAGRIRK